MNIDREVFVQIPGKVQVYFCDLPGYFVISVIRIIVFARYSLIFMFGHIL